MICVAKFRSVFIFGTIKFKRHVFKFYFDMFTRFIKKIKKAIGFVSSPCNVSVDQIMLLDPCFILSPNFNMLLIVIYLNSDTVQDKMSRKDGQPLSTSSL